MQGRGRRASHAKRMHFSLCSPARPPPMLAPASIVSRALRRPAQPSPTHSRTRVPGASLSCSSTGLDGGLTGPHRGAVADSRHSLVGRENGGARSRLASSLHRRAVPRLSPPRPFPSPRPSCPSYTAPHRHHTVRDSSSLPLPSSVFVTLSSTHTNGAARPARPGRCGRRCQRRGRLHAARPG